MCKIQETMSKQRRGEGIVTAKFGTGAEENGHGGKMVMTEVVQFREGEWSLQNWPV